MSQNQQVRMRDGLMDDEDKALGYFNGIEHVKRCDPTAFQLLCARVHDPANLPLSEEHKRYLCAGGLARIDPMTNRCDLTCQEDELRRYIKLCSRPPRIFEQLSEAFNDHVSNARYTLVRPFHQSFVRRVIAYCTPGDGSI